MLLATLSRRNLLKTTALAAAAQLGAPFVRHSSAAGKLALGVWDHWVPGANTTLTRLCNEWGEKNKVEVTIDRATIESAEVAVGRHLPEGDLWAPADGRCVLV